MNANLTIEKFLLRLKLRRPLRDEAYRELRGFLDTQHWQPIPAEPGLVVGLIASEGEHDELRKTLRSLIGLYDLMAVEWLKGESAGTPDSQAGLSAWLAARSVSEKLI
jgi:hypothetical protein